MRYWTWKLSNQVFTESSRERTITCILTKTGKIIWVFREETARPFPYRIYFSVSVTGTLKLCVKNPCFRMVLCFYFEWCFNRHEPRKLPSHINFVMLKTSLFTCTNKFLAGFDYVPAPISACSESTVASRALVLFLSGVCCSMAFQSALATQCAATHVTRVRRYTTSVEFPHFLFMVYLLKRGSIFRI